MKIFQKHLLSNIPASLGLTLQTDEQFLPREYISYSLETYYNPPTQGNNIPLEIDHNNIIFKENSKLPLTHNLQSGQLSNTLYFKIPNK